MSTVFHNRDEILQVRVGRGGVVRHRDGHRLPLGEHRGVPHRGEGRLHHDQGTGESSTLNPTCCPREVERFFPSTYCNEKLKSSVLHTLLEFSDCSWHKFRFCFPLSRSALSVASSSASRSPRRIASWCRRSSVGTSRRQSQNSLKV